MTDKHNRPRFRCVINDGADEWAIELRTHDVKRAWTEAARRAWRDTRRAYAQCDGLPSTVALDLEVTRISTGEVIQVGVVTVDPPEPPCKPRRRHKWIPIRGPIGSGAGICMVNRCSVCRHESVYDSGGNDHRGRTMVSRHYRPAEVE